MTHCDVILYTPTFSKPAFIFKTCLHFQNLPSFSKPAFIFKTCLHFQNLPSVFAMKSLHAFLMWKFELRSLQNAVFRPPPLLRRPYFFPYGQ